MIDVYAYKEAAKLSKNVWDRVSEWDWFSKKTIGSQFVRAADSIAANIAEAYGRHHKKDKMKFYYYSRGSTYESQFWCKKAFERSLLSDSKFKMISSSLLQLPKELNALIRQTSYLKH